MNELTKTPVILQGDPSRHLSLAELERGITWLEPGKDRGQLALLVARTEEGRQTPHRVTLTRAGGMPGDGWARRSPDKTDAQLTMMRADVARLFANGQPLWLFGDNLLVELDLSLSNLPAGSRLTLGTALLEVTPQPHTGCAKFRQRFGEDAFRLTAAPRFRDLRLRGIYVKVIQEGEVTLGDSIEVRSRG